MGKERRKKEKEKEEKEKKKEKKKSYVDFMTKNSIGVFIFSLPHNRILSQTRPN